MIKMKNKFPWQFFCANIFHENYEEGKITRKTYFNIVCLFRHNNFYFIAVFFMGVVGIL
jgi:hypothetical protein